MLYAPPLRARRRALITVAAMAALVAVGAAAPLAAQTGAGSHDKHDAHGAHGAPARLALDHGRKWATDAPLRTGMNNLRALVAPQVPAARRGALAPAQYADLAAKVEAEVGTIVAQCQLTPAADAMLHLVIADLAAGANAMAGKDAHRTPAAGLRTVAHALDQYGRYFDHPGFRPLGGGAQSK